MEAAFDIVVVSRGQAWPAGHGPVDGSDILMTGVAGDDLTVEQGAEASRLAGLSMLASLERALGDLFHVTRWVRAAVYVHSVPHLSGPGLTKVGDGFSALIRAIWGNDGGHARVSPGDRCEGRRGELGRRPRQPANHILVMAAANVTWRVAQR